MRINKLILSLLFIVSALGILDRTYYNALKIPISAGPEQIKEAYRKLSRKYHPDRNPKARSKFEKINVAYQTLSNEEQKYIYDRVGHQKMTNPNIQQQMNLATMKGQNLEISLRVTLEDLYNGKQFNTTIFKNMACPHCQGSGAQNQYDIVRCQECNGQGKKTKRVPVGGGYYNMMQEQCPRCKGEGKIVGRKCNTCSGEKIIPNSEEFTVKIEPGTSNYDVLKYVNMGEQRLQGAPGDLFIRIQELSHPYLTRQAQHLRTSVTISLREALQGFERTIIQLDGRQLKISNNAITQPGQIFVVQGQGMPIKGTEQKGNMYVTVNVHIPRYQKSQLTQLTSLMDSFN